jgi:penicillin amidase
MTAEADASSNRGRRARRRLVFVALVAMLLLLIAAGAGALWTRAHLKGSLPRLDGRVAVNGPSAPVAIARDASGVPDIRARRELDVLFALGFLHGQERFFQMDLSRRSAAGELAELFGEPAIGRDERMRVFRFRARAQRIAAGLDPEDERRVVAYTRGVNAGLDALDTPPFEYLLLRAEPRPWRPADSLLVVFSMYELLQDGWARHERERAALQARLPGPLADFLDPAGGRWDAAIDGTELAPAPIPGPEVYDLRERPEPFAGAAGADRPLLREPAVHGSNAWAVAGPRRGGGPALVANDMHLPISLPNTWYRARLRVEGGAGGDPELDVTGVTLPGVPGVVAGSNGRVAWGFTNSYADTADLVIVEVDPENPERYRTPGGWRGIEVRTERIEVARGEPVEVELRGTIWGPILGEDPRGRPLAVRWVALEPGALDLGLLELARARTVDEVVARARRSGLPAQNIVAGDADGRIAWTIAGRLPRRVGFDGRVPTSWADGNHRWEGLLEPERVPAKIDPAGGLLWTANNRIVGGDALRLLGDGGYVLGARARQIRDGLRDLERCDEQAMLEIQRDDRALFLERWRRLLLDTLDTATGEQDEPRLAEIRKLVADWEGRAAVDSAGYRLVRGFRTIAARSALDPLLAPCREEPGGFSGLPGHRWEYPAWALFRERPAHLLDPAYESWQELLLDAARRLADRLTADDRPLRTKTWGERNVFQARHPLSYAVPLLGRWVDLPPTPLSGDLYMPLVQGDDFGASERLAVAPGAESEGIFHMPGGQSGHPGSPHYAAGHQAWVDRRPAPFLPGAPKHELELVPME